ncbi:MAG: translation initiation factor IF-2 subunit gamma [Candidatus Altiarchaeota archaeon]
MQSEVNIGLVGHVDHGKTTLTKALSGVWTDRHSEEIKRGISIRLGYADCDFYKCQKCVEPDCYSTQETCKHCGSKADFLRRVSFVDSPGHETLMATMLSGAALMDGAVLVIAANEECPQPQTAEHLIALDSLGVKKVVIAQNKIDVVDRQKAVENYRQILEFVKGTCAEKAPIIPLAAHYNANVDLLIQAIQDVIITPERDLTKPARMNVARSFDVNRPGSPLKDLKGGVIGGSLIQGQIKVGDEIEILPGVKKKNNYNSVTTRITSISVGSESLETAEPGGLIAFGTELDPFLTKSDSLSGSVAGKPATLPPVRDSLSIDVTMIERLVGVDGKVQPLVKGEPLMVSSGSAVTVGMVVNPKGELNLKLPICVDSGSKIALSRRIGARWHLIGYGIVKD